MKENQRRRLSAGVVGAGGGTLLLAVVEAMPDTSEYKKILTLLTPSLSVALGSLTYIGWQQLQAWWLARELAEAQNTIYNVARAGLNDTHASDSHKTALRNKIEEFEQFRLQGALQLYQSVEEDRRNILQREHKAD